MAIVPKGKTSRSRTRSRKANWKAQEPQTIICPSCKEQSFAHTACPSCGVYKGRMYKDAQREK